MGGGAAMRAAAKVAGYGIGFRHLPSVPLSEQAAQTAARRCPSTVPAVVSAGGDAVASANTWIEASPAVQRPLMEMDDWDFAGVEEGELFDSSANPPYRVVFGAVPTIEEAREATSDLKEALEKVYFSSPVVSDAEGSKIVPVSHRSEPISLGYPETKTCVSSESAAINPSVPKPVLNAFYLLKESPEVQNIVASLAADTNVWEAVMKNEKVMEFYQSQKTAGVLLSNLNEDMVESYAANGYLTSSDESVEQSSETSGNRFTRLVDNIKMQVAKMVSNLSEFFQNLFKTSAEECSSADAKGGSTDFMDKAAGASFIALGILAIVVVLLKRK
eukprot:TRINITY_DN1687_c0_g1_i3.p1 TRINITY_DN1687_c0_g1~~TRINITY_DN1687_c0_g1_i3.p1  ORF type:complete len:331 (-),score=64.83 TRINITY_DN1687_c0_g1_i3:1034-2026(-)